MTFDHFYRPGVRTGDALAPCTACGEAPTAAGFAARHQAAEILCARCMRPADTAAGCAHCAAFDRAIAYANNRGNERGRAAASWYEIRDAATAARVLRGIADGDPEILDTFPYADLSGEYADSLTGPQLFRDACEAAGIDPDSADAFDGSFNDICDAYDASFQASAVDEIERTARYQADAS